MADRRRRLDIDDDRVIDIDQVIGRIGEERWSAVRRGPSRRRIAWCDELRCDLARRAERGVVENREIFLDSAAGRRWWQTRRTLDAVSVAGIGLDQTGINGEAFTADQALIDAPLQDRLEQAPQQIAVAEAAGRFFEKVE